jgi:hypothetical protein
MKQISHNIVTVTYYLLSAWKLSSDDGSMFCNARSSRLASPRFSPIGLVLVHGFAIYAFDVSVSGGGPDLTDWKAHGYFQRQVVLTTHANLLCAIGLDEKKPAAMPMTALGRVRR